MGSELSPRPRGAAKARSDDNSYSTLQAKLKAISDGMDDVAVSMTNLHRLMKKAGAQAEQAAGDIENAEFDQEFIEQTEEAATKLGAALTRVRTVERTAHDASEQAHTVRAQHRKLYQALHTVRSTRRHRTPKPGTFIQ